jgi:hypothetical protein
MARIGAGCRTVLPPPTPARPTSPPRRLQQRRFAARGVAPRATVHFACRGCGSHVRVPVPPQMNTTYTKIQDRSRQVGRPLESRRAALIAAAAAPPLIAAAAAPALMGLLSLPRAGVAVADDAPRLRGPRGPLAAAPPQPPRGRLPPLRRLPPPPSPPGRRLPAARVPPRLAMAGG